MSEKSKIIWRCRRGIKELDVLFTRFVENDYDGLSAADNAAFHRLLKYEDPIILRCVLGQEDVEDPEVHAIIKKMCSAP